MARRILLFAIIGLLGTSARAQSQRVQVGASAGMTAATQNEHASGRGLSADSETAYLFAPAVSVFLIRPVAPWLAARMDAGFVRKGHRRVGGDRPDLTEIIRLDMFSLRVAGEAGRSVGDGLWAYGVLGPRLDVLVGEESEFEVEGQGQGGRTTNIRYDEFVVGGVVGGGVRFDVGIGDAVQIEALLDQDILPAYSTDDLTVRGRAFILHAGVLF